MFDSNMYFNNDEMLLLNQIALDKSKSETMNSIMIALAGTNVLNEETKELLRGIYLKFQNEISVNVWENIQKQMPFDIPYNTNDFELEEEYTYDETEDWTEEDIAEFKEMIRLAEEKG